MKLTTGDKIRIKETGEGAEIVSIIDETTAKVETFDGIIKVRSIEVIPFQASDVKAISAEEVSFYQQSTKTNKESDPVKEWNTKKNQFQYFLDLHAEQLIGDISTKSDEEILSIQISRVKEYILQAQDLRIQRVYIIHGIGSGRLKSEVHSLLNGLRGVRSFANEYDSRFGMGATEVKL